jgi:ElaB/YqjD/DUF883 family membrane-anchored ribosome-binding protein
LSDEQEIREAVDEAKAPGVFNIVELLQGRGYPTQTVEIYLNESAIYNLASEREKLEELIKSLGKRSEKESEKNEREKIESAIHEAQEDILASKVFVFLQGVTEGKRDEIYRQATKKYPVEYEAPNPMSGLLGKQSERIEKESADRDQLFTDLLWQAYIAKVVNADGDEQSEFAYSTIRTMRDSLPLNAMVKINEAIDKLRSSTALFDLETTEDFLAKP